MIVAIFIVPLIYFLNAFLIGRLLKKFNLGLNPFLASIIGFVAFFDVIYILSIWMYIGKAIVWSYFVVVGVIQTALIGLYIANWRYIYITTSFNYKKIITFGVSFGLTILIGWLCLRPYNSEFGINWINTITYMQHDVWGPITFNQDFSNIISNFSAFNIMNTFWANAFQIKDTERVLTFCNWSWTIIAAGFIACLSTWQISRKTSIPRFIFSILIVMLLVVLTLAFIESYAVGDSWILLLLLVYILVMVKQENSSPLKLFMLTTILLGFLASSCTSFYAVLCVWIFSMYYTVRNKLNSFNYFLVLSWPLFLTIFSFISISVPWLLSLINTLYLLFIIILLIIYRRVGIPVASTKIAMGAYNHSGKIVYAGLALLIAIILVTNFLIFQELYHWDGSKIDYHNFLTFTYSYIWTFNITSIYGIAIFNAIMYTVFVALTITYLVIRKQKNNKLYPLCKNDSVIKFGIVSCILFINPLVIHVLKISTQGFPLNTMDLNMLFVIPIFALLLKTINNVNLTPIQSWKYDWY